MNRVFFAALVVFAIATAATPSDARKTKSVATPTPLPTPVVPGVAQPSGPMAYFLMSGTMIVSPAYPNLGDCYKDLASIKRTLQPGTDSLVCVHRRR